MTHPNTTGDDAMSETQFAKLFHIDGRQVLVYLCEGDEHDYDLHQIARTSFGMMDAKSSFNVSPPSTRAGPIPRMKRCASGTSGSASELTGDPP